MSDGELPPLSLQARELFAMERARGPEPEALKQRALERAREALLQDRPSGVALRGVNGSTRPSASRRAPRTVLLFAAAVAVAGLAAAGAGVYRWQSPSAVVRPIEARSVIAPVSQSVALHPQPVVPSAVVEAPRAAAPGRPKSPAPAETAVATSIQTYALETGLLEPARRGIGGGNYASALAAIAQHQREYPRGQLAEEREALRVRALWGMGQKPAAERAAAAFRKRYPRSGLLSWMKEPAKPEP